MIVRTEMRRGATLCQNNMNPLFFTLRNASHSIKNYRALDVNFKAVFGNLPLMLLHMS